MNHRSENRMLFYTSILLNQEAEGKQDYGCLVLAREGGWRSFMQTARALAGGTGKYSPPSGAGFRRGV